MKIQISNKLKAHLWAVWVWVWVLQIQKCYHPLPNTVICRIHPAIQPDSAAAPFQLTGCAGTGTTCFYYATGKFMMDDKYCGRRPGYQPGSVVGCGVNLATNQPFFTQSGQLLGIAYDSSGLSRNSGLKNLNIRAFVRFPLKNKNGLEILVSTLDFFQLERL